MIARRVFFGIGLERKLDRRRFVAGYWAVCVAGLVGLASLILRDPGWMDHSWVLISVGMSAGLLLFGLGGSAAGGPVRSFDGEGMAAQYRWSPLGMADRALSGPAFQADTLREGPLDERDRDLRNAAHYEAYRLMRLLVIYGAVLLMCLSRYLEPYRGLEIPAGILAFFMFWNLPQTLILWHEPDVDEAGSGK